MDECDKLERDMIETSKATSRTATSIGMGCNALLWHSHHI